MTRLTKLFAVVVITTLGLAACGFQPVYLGDSGRATALSMASVDIKPIPDRTGQIMRNTLQNLITPRGKPRDPRYALSVGFDENISKTSVRTTSFATRANLRLTVNYTLTDTKSGQQVVSNSTLSISSYDIFDNEFATLVAENDAREKAAEDAAKAVATQITVALRRYQQQ